MSRSQYIASLRAAQKLPAECTEEPTDQDVSTDVLKTEQIGLRLRRHTDLVARATRKVQK